MVRTNVLSNQNALYNWVQVINNEIPEEDVVFYEPGVTVKDNEAHVQTYTYVKTPFDPMDVSLNPQTPSELQTIMKSKPEMHAVLKNVSVDGKDMACRDLNQVRLSEHFSSYVFRKKKSRYSRISISRS